MKDVRYRQQCMRNNRYDLSAQTGAILKEMLTLQRLSYMLRNETGENGEKRLPLHDFYHIRTRCVQYLELLPTGDIHILQNSLSSFKNFTANYVLFYFSETCYYLHLKHHKNRI